MSAEAGDRDVKDIRACEDGAIVHADVSQWHLVPEMRSNHTVNRKPV